MEQSASSLVARLIEVPPFADLEAEELHRLASLFDQIAVEQGARIHQPADAHQRCLYVILDGELSVYRDEVARAIQLQGRYGPGDYFGEQGLFGDDGSTSALARSETKLARIAHDVLLGFLDEHPDVALRLQMAAARRHSENVAAVLDSSGRSDPRIRVGHEAVLDLPFGQKATARLENLSVGGLCLDGIPDTWKPGMRMAFLLRLNDEVIPVDARVSWRQGSFAGLAFADPDDAHERRIQRILRQLRDELENEVGAY
ncbi:MAG: cyclic nucleotide-binding domain-containing protein [Thermoanaerobaculia bacterium]|nr:cyclic nucleotide-binding domain-containing protein [Thermoanaerobaculia bacterium]